MTHHSQPITEEIADQIHHLHHEYPELGHEGIAHLLEEDGVHLDEYELRMFMDEHHLDPGPTATWKSRLLGRFPFGMGRS